MYDNPTNRGLTNYACDRLLSWMVLHVGVHPATSCTGNGFVWKWGPKPMGLSQFSLLFDGHLGIYAILKQIQIPELVYGKIWQDL